MRGGVMLTLVLAGCDRFPRLWSEEARAICEHLYRTQQLRGERDAAVMACYKAIQDEVGLADQLPTPTQQRSSMDAEKAMVYAMGAFWIVLMGFVVWVSRKPHE